MQRVSPLISRDIANYLTNKETWSFIYVLSNYAKGDGVTDDSAAINDLINQIGDKFAVIAVNEGTYFLNQIVHFPQNIELWFLQGGKLSPAMGVDFTIDGPIEAGVFQIFTGDGTVVGMDTQYHMVAWWGVKGDGITDETDLVQKVIDATIAAGRKAIYFHKGTYVVTALTNDNLVVFFGDNASFTGGYTGHIYQIGDDPIWHSVDITGDLDMHSHKIINLAAPTAANDGARKTDIDTAIATTAKNPATADLDMTTHKVINLAAPTNPNDAARLTDVQNVPTIPVYRQAIINGNFQVWQRGVSFTNPSGGYTTDRYFVSFSPDGGTLPTTITHLRNTLGSGELDPSQYAYQVNWNGAGSGFGTSGVYGVFQRIENGTRLLCGANKKVTVSFYARSNIGSKRIGLSLSQRYGSGGSPSAAELLGGTAFNLTAAFQKFTFTVNTNTLSGKTFGTDNSDYLQVGFFHMWQSAAATANGLPGTEGFGAAGLVDIAQVQVNAGDTALPFQPRSFGEELALCQRYYEKSFSYGTSPAHGVGATGIHAMRSSVADNFQSFPRIIYKVTKRATPTFTIYNPSNASPGSNVIRVFGTGADVPAQVAEGNENGIRISVSNVSVPGLNDLGVHWTAEAEL
jgi:hypothetical protein